jgi:hypothetical protein
MISAYHGIKIVSLLDPVATDATADATPAAGVDVTGFRDCLMCIYLGVGATLAAGVYYTFTFEECDDDATWTTIVAADMEDGLSGTRVVNATTEDEQLIVRGYKGTKRYVRILGTLSGTDTSDTTMAFFVVLANPLHIPITIETETA